MTKLQKQLRTYLSRAGVKSDQLNEAVEVFERRFKDYYGIEFQATDDQGQYIEYNNERLTPSAYIESLRDGKVGSDAEKKFFSSHFMNQSIRNARGTVEDDTGDMNTALRRAAGFKSDE